MNKETRILGIDCDPFTRCQETAANYIFREILGVEVPKRLSASFGCWEYPIEYPSAEKRKEVENYLRHLYACGRIRGARW